MGGGHRDYARYHEVLNRAVWSSREVARVLLLGSSTWNGPLIFGIDETLAPSIPRPGSRHQLSSGLRWISLMWLGHPGPDAIGRLSAGALDAVLPAAGTPPQETHRLVVICVACPSAPYNSYAVLDLPLLPVPRQPVALIARLRRRSVRTSASPSRMAGQARGGHH